MKKLSYLLGAILMMFSMHVYSAGDYTFKNDTDIDLFMAEHSSPISVDNLTITGTVTQDKFDKLIDAITSVDKAFTMKDLTVPSGDAGPGIRTAQLFLSEVKMNGSIILKDCAFLSWIGGDQDGVFIGMPAHIKGDLILDNIGIPYPNVDGWHNDTSFGVIEEVDGDLSIIATKSLQKGGKWLHKLEKVGGNFTVHFFGSPDTWEFYIPNLTHIGGNLEYKAPLEGYGLDNNGNPIQSNFWGLESLKNVTHIGGSVKILNFNMDSGNRLNWGSSGDWGEAGLCWIRQMIDDEYINYACYDVILGYEDAPIDLYAADKTPCADGVTPSPVAPYDLPDKDPNCAEVSTPKVADAQANAFIQDGILNINSKIDLAKVELFTIDGKSVLNLTNVAAGEIAYPVGNLSTGIYIVKVIGVDNSVEAYKVAK